MSSLARMPIVYVSSTFVDLAQHRAALKVALEKAQYVVECIEKYPAFDKRPLDKCRADVARADVYVLLIAHRYGYRPTEGNPDGKSITQLEYEEAGRNPSKPRLVFTVDPDQPWLKKWIDDGLSEDGQALAAFRAEVETRHGRAMFSDPDQLASLVLQALSAREERAPSPASRTYPPADLDAWVVRHHQTLERSFSAIPSVQARQVHVPLDVCLTPAGAEATEGPRLLKPEDLESLLDAAGSHVLLLSGDGGAGKTSLAFAIARWLLAGQPGGVVRLPVLIETGLEERETVVHKVWAWLDDQLNEPPSPELVNALLRERRLVPILDHVSELTPAARQRLLAGLPPGLVIATSRSEDDGWKGRALSRIVPRPIALDRLQSFFVEYLKGRGQGEVLRDDELVPAQNQLRRIVGDKPITALLAQMFIEDVIANRHKGLLAGSVPQLMLSYVRRLDTPVDPSQRERGGLTIDGERVQRALKCLALASHRQLGGDGEPAYQPREFSRALAKDTLQKPEPDGLELRADEAEGLLGYLAERRLLVHPGADSSELRFPLDPLADYLAALLQLEVLERMGWSTGQKASWEAFLLAMERRQGQAEDLSRARGFLLALRDAALERRGRGVPADGPDRLAELGGLNPEGERERQAEQRARKWMWELLVPNASERRDAINKLAAMAAWAAAPEERRSVAVVASDRLSQVLANGELLGEERKEAAMVLGLIGTGAGIKALERLASDGAQPPELRRAALEALGLTARDQAEHRQRIEMFLEEQLHADALDLLVAGEEGWAEHDQRLPPLQGASRALQLAASADLPLLGSGPGRLVPMLTLTALNRADGHGLEVRTEVLKDVPVWRLPLPEGEQLEMVLVPGGDYLIGSPEGEAGKPESYIWMPENKELDKEPQRQVRLAPLAMTRFPITQDQWAAVAELEPGLKPAPGTYEAKGLWEAHCQPGCLPVDSVSWNDCQEWLARLNRWLAEQWRKRGLAGEVPELRLPGEGEWEAACRAESETPFHFGDMLDSGWAIYDHTERYGVGRIKGTYAQRPLAIGSHGLVNRWGLAEMHGQMYEWCGDLWHPSPIGGPQDGSPWEDPDPSPEAIARADNRLLRGGSWIDGPHSCRAAFRFCFRPGRHSHSDLGVRPCCLLPTGSILGS